MRINIKVKLNSKNEVVEKEETEEYIVCINEKPVKGKANKKVIELIAKHFGVKKGSVFIIRGEKNKEKVVEILD